MKKMSLVIIIFSFVLGTLSAQEKILFTKEIAEIVGITQNNVRVKMTRIREKLRTMLVKNE